MSGKLQDGKCAARSCNMNRFGAARQCRQDDSDAQTCHRRQAGAIGWCARSDWDSCFPSADDVGKASAQSPTSQDDTRTMMNQSFVCPLRATRAVHEWRSLHAAAPEARLADSVCSTLCTAKHAQHRRAWCWGGQAFVIDCWAC